MADKFMSLHIKSDETHKLAKQLARLTGESLLNFDFEFV